MDKIEKFVSKIKDTHKKIAEILALPSDVLERKIKNWTVKETIIHIISWRKEILKIMKKALKEKNPEWDYFLKTQEELDKWNEREIEKRKHKTQKKLKEELEKLLKEWIKFLERINEKDLKRKFQPPWEEETTIEECIEIEIEHAKEHLNKIKKLVENL